MFRSWIALALLFVLQALLAARSSAESNLGSFEMHGKVGDYPIGLNFTVRDNTHLVTAHYFYAAQLKDIPLTGEVKDEVVVFKGEDGAIFQLRFVGNSSNGNDPLTFYNSVGLKGTWVLGAHTLPVTLQMEYSTANPGQRFYESVTSQSDAEFEHMVQVTRRAILDKDIDRASRLVHFPLTVNLPHRSIKVKSLAELKANWFLVFTPALVAKLRNDLPHEMFIHEGEVMLGQGEIWFDQSGLTVVNEE